MDLLGWVAGRNAAAYVRQAARTRRADPLESSGTENPGRVVERSALLASSYLSPDPKAHLTELKHSLGESLVI